MNTNSYSKFQVNITKENRESMENWMVTDRLRDGQIIGKQIKSSGKPVEDL